MVSRSLVDKLFAKGSVREYGYVLEVNRVAGYVKVRARNGLRVKMDSVIDIKDINPGERIIYGWVSNSAVILDKVVAAGTKSQLLIITERVDPVYRWVANDIPLSDGADYALDTIWKDQINEAKLTPTAIVGNVKKEEGEANGNAGLVLIDNVPGKASTIHLGAVAELLASKNKTIIVVYKSV